MHINLNGHKFYYQQLGTGKEVVIMFHGYGQDGNIFIPLTEGLKNQYTFYIFDLFFHGSSSWNRSVPYLTKGFFKQLMTKFLKKEKISTFSIVGFSMGGRFALVSQELFPEKVKKTILLAPDGIKTSFWYNMATYPTVFRKIFKQTIFSPGIYQSIVKVLSKSGLVDRGMLKFANTQMDTCTKRMRVYFSWVVFSKLLPDTKRIIAQSNHHKLPVEIIIGSFDKVVNESNMKSFVNKISSSRLHILKSGHTNLITNSKKIFQSLLTGN